MARTLEQLEQMLIGSEPMLRQSADEISLAVARYEDLIDSVSPLVSMMPPAMAEKFLPHYDALAVALCRLSASAQCVANKLRERASGLSEL